MKSFKHLLAISLLTLITSNCKSQCTIDSLSKLLVNKERNDNEELYSKFSEFGVKSIPYLINVIDKDETGFVGYQDKNSSTIYPIHYNYVGIRAAYMIEYIIAGSHEQKLFNYCVIVKRINSKVIMESLTMDDMKSIKDYYKSWWSKNESKSPDELSEEWKHENRVLSNTNYLWK
jgi:hypothetical protein